MNKLIKYLAVLVFSVSLIFPNFVQAAGLVPCGGPNEVPCNFCEFVSMTNGIITWVIGVMLVVFAIIVVVAGMGMVTSGGNPAAKTAAKSKLSNAIIGLIIILAAWLLVDTVMLGLLTGGRGEISGFGPWSEVTCGAPPVGAGVGAAAAGPATCAACVDIPSNIITKGAVTCMGSVSPTGNCQLASSILSKVNNFQTAVSFAGVSGARVTEAWPPTGWTPSDPTGVHVSSCHGDGTCFDYGKPGITPAEIQKIFTAAQSSGLVPSYEVETQADKNILVAGGVTGTIVVNDTSAAHFHIK